MKFRLKSILNKEQADYFLAFDWQVSFAYFFNKYLEKDIFAIAYDGSNIYKNPSLEDLKGKKVAMYVEDLSFKKYTALQNKFHIIDISKEINQLRLIKTSTEIEKIKKACHTTKSFLENFTWNLAHVSEKEIAKEIKKYYIEQEMEEAFQAIVAYDKNAYILHHKPTNAVNPSKVILIDTGAKYKGYASDLTRTVILDPQLKQYHEDVNNTLEMLEDLAIEGASTKALTAFAKEALKKYKKASFFYHHLLGHGVGIEVHEDPSFKDNNTTLKRNMVIALEPGIYVKNNFGIRIENTYVIKKKKAKKLC